MRGGTTPRVPWAILTVAAVLLCPDSPRRTRTAGDPSSSHAHSCVQFPGASRHGALGVRLASAEHVEAAAASPAGAPLPAPPDGPDTALYLDGANLGRLRSGSPRFHLKPGTSSASPSITLEAWVMRRRDDASERVFSFGVSAPDDARHDGTVRDASRGLHFGFHGVGKGNNRLRFSFPCRSTRSFLDAPPGLVPARSGEHAPHLRGARHWHHIAATYDARTGRRVVYVDGRVVASDVADAQYALLGDFTLGGVAASETYPREALLPDVGCAAGSFSCLHIARANAWTLPSAMGDGVGAPSGFVGKVDEVRVWGTALHARHIAEFSSLSGNAVRVAHPAAAALEMYYRFNEGNGTVVHDWSAHRRDLELRRGYAVIPARRMPHMGRTSEGGSLEARLDAFYGLEGLGDERFYGLNAQGLGAKNTESGVYGGGDVRERQPPLLGDAHGAAAGDGFYGLGEGDGFYGFYGVNAAGEEESGEGAGTPEVGAGVGVFEGGTEGVDQTPRLPSAWMEGVGKNGCCASNCQLCEGGYSVKRNTVGTRVTGL